jgi:ABC-type lipoprotein release transport system permease subunit
MLAVTTRFRADLRARWRSWALLALIVGVLAGSGVAVAAGARRTDSALPRFLAATRSPDVLTFGTDDPGSVFANVSFDDIAALPQVMNSGRVELPEVARPIAVELVAPIDEAVGDSFFRKKLLSGRLPDPHSATEAAISFTLADEYALHVGDQLDLDLRRTDGDGLEPTEHVSLSIVGIEVSATEFPPQEGEGTLAAWTTPAFLTAHPAVATFHALAVRLHGGSADVSMFQSEVNDLAAGRPLQSFALADQAVNTQRSIHLQAVTLWLLAALLAGVGGLFISQLLARQGQLEASEYPSLRAIGLTSRQLWSLGILRALVIGVAGAAIASGIAVAVSPLLPVGLARVAEPNPGVMFDGVAVAFGAVGTVVAVVLLAAWPAYRVGRRDRFSSTSAPVEQPSMVTSALIVAGAPPTLTIGVRLALERGRGPTSVPVRSSIAIAAVAVAAVAGAVVFRGSLDMLLDQPARYGVLWDAEVIAVGSSTEGVSAAGDAALTDPDVDAVSEGYAGVPLAIGDLRVSGIAVGDRRGPSLMATLLDGRFPVGAGEVILGTQTMRELHVAIGDSVTIQVAGTPAEPSYKIVGRASFPSLADGLGLGKGAGFTLAGLQSTLPEGLAPPSDTALIRFRDGADPSTTYDRIDQEVSSSCACALLRPTKPVDVVNFGRVQYFPIMLAALVGGLGVLTLAHLLVSATRRRRRDLAVLVVLGFVPGQIRRAVAWQATTVAIAAALLGLPVGIVGGRYAWTRFTHQLGVTAPPRVPVLAVLVLIPLGSMIVANAAALFPARTAVSTRSSRVLHDQ